jgi:cytochrome P450
MNAPAHTPPPPLPSGRLLGHAGPISQDPLGFFLRVREQGGDVVRLRFGPAQVTFLYRPEHVQRVLVDNVSNYIKDTGGYARLRRMLGQGLVTSSGDFWRRQRRIANPAFHHRAIAGFADAMVSAARDRADLWAGSAARGEPLDMAGEMTALTLRIAGETLLGSDISQSSSKLGGALTEALAWYADTVGSAFLFLDYLPTPRNLRFERALGEMKAVVDAVIAERRVEGEPRPDLLGMFMAAVDEETGEGMSDEHLRDEVLTMLLAGHETTANALAWILHLLSLHPEVCRRLEAELERVLGGRDPEMADLPKLTYTTQVIHESLRLYPPVWALGRKAEAEDVIGGHRIPAGEYVFFSPYAIHRHPDLWENPEGFDPSRFAGDGPRGPGGERLHRLAWFPFSGGQRKCIGDRFAMMEAQIILAVLLQRYRLSLVPGHPVVPDPSVTLRPRDGVLMTPRAR